MPLIMQRKWWGRDCRVVWKWMCRILKVTASREPLAYVDYHLVSVWPFRFDEPGCRVSFVSQRDGRSALGVSVRF